MILILSDAGWRGDIVARFNEKGVPAVSTNLFHAASSVWRMRKTVTGIVLMTSSEDSFSLQMSRLSRLIVRCRRVKSVLVCYDQKWLRNGTLSAFNHRVAARHMSISIPIGHACISSIFSAMTISRAG